MPNQAIPAVSISPAQREGLIQTLAAATFLIFFQAYMVAPLIPGLSHSFQVSEQFIGLMVPAYMIPYGLSTLFYGLLSDRLGRRRTMLGVAGCVHSSHPRHRDRAHRFPTSMVEALDGIGREWGGPVGAGADRGFVSIRATRAASRLAFWGHGRWNGIRFQLWSHTYSVHWLAHAFCRCGIWDCGRIRAIATIQCHSEQTNNHIGPLCSRCAEGVPQSSRQRARSSHLRVRLAQ